MRRLTRTFVYAALLFALLAFVSFWFYHSPSQVERRLQSVIDRLLTVRVELEACRSDPLGAGLQIAAVRVPASPSLGTVERIFSPGATRSGFRRPSPVGPRLEK